MSEMRTKIMRDASYLLPPPGGEVVRDLLDSYDTLLARHNALREAVAWMLECDSCPLKNTTEAEKHGFAALWATRRAARAEVDRLIVERPAE